MSWPICVCGHSLFSHNSLGCGVSNCDCGRNNFELPDGKPPSEQPIGPGEVITPRASSLPATAAERKKYPVAGGVLDYFPDAIVAVAHVSYVGNEQHNPGEPLHWAREKSTDEPEAMMRHFIERGKLDSDGLRHSAKMVWRALALLQKEIEAERK